MLWEKQIKYATFPLVLSVPLLLEFQNREVQKGETTGAEGWLLGPISFCITLSLKWFHEFLLSNEFDLSVYTNNFCHVFQCGEIERFFYKIIENLKNESLKTQINHMQLGENTRVKASDQIIYSSAREEAIWGKLPTSSLKLFHKYCLNNLLDM